ncbi:S8 family serine peptidase [Frankia sp. AgB1.9]|uniref:S8 family serine peptidase n=1 Tax=unclassified Frankia TaxID=2632575 RepID=UPI0019333575|nr:MULTISPECIES: S8 family serine peptidase [unclassified Frankia]MBL7494424.1 S8 family serine peptidase [Frankia sp. AgW1.1]MBL7550107.1 S8 family serine peptidase [Frankia sp. AgB1.9]MBL7621149.1 S8 family serine peptidase [Frankia sp. AgB1.8]
MTEPSRPLTVTVNGHTFDPVVGPPAPAPGDAFGGAAGAGLRMIVQVHRPLRRAEHDRLRDEFGLALTDYLPELAYVESIPAASVARVAADPLVRAVTPFVPAFRLSAGIGARTFRTDAGRGRNGRRLEAVLFGDADPDTALAAVRGHGGGDAVVLDERVHGGAVKIRFTMPDGDLAALATVDDIRWLDEVGEAKHDASETAAATTSETPVVPGPAAVPVELARGWAAPLWNAGLHGEGQIIGMMDSPVDLGHCLFADATNPVGPLHRKVVWFRDAAGGPPGRHGTFVAGIAAGDDPAAPGGHPDRGVAWAARLTYGNADDIETTGVLGYLGAAAADGARVHTNSWHDEPTPQYNQLSADVDAFAWHNEDHLVLGSSGNTGEAMGPPGTAKNALSVSASRGGTLDGFGDGTTGPSEDGRHKPELVAPGCSIRSAAVGSGCAVKLDRVVFGSAGPICATSWATPAVAGLAALARQYYVDGYHPSGTPSPPDALVPSGALLKATLLAGCVDLSGPATYPSNTTGWGRIRLENVLALPGSARRPRVWDRRNADGIATGESTEHPVDVAGPGEPLTITLVWTEPPGAAGAAVATVNVLELTALPPDGGPALRANVFAGGFSVPGDATDRLNNVRRVLVRVPAAGRWTVVVSGVAVNVGDPGQGYALVAAGDLG